MTYPLSLAAGNVQEFDPPDMVSAAHHAGFDMTGLWVDLDHWTHATTREVKSRLAAADVTVLDVEVVWIQPGPSNPIHKKTIDIGAELGAQFVLIVSSDPDRSATKSKFEELCTHAGTNEMTAVLEFLPITEIKSLTDALDVVEDVAHPSSGILVDTLHLIRSGSTIDAVQAADPGLFPYCQIADAPAALADPTFEKLMSEAIDGRLLPGDGELPLADIMNALPTDLPVSPEIRSLALREKYPDISDRARAIYQSSRAFLDSL